MAHKIPIKSHVWYFLKISCTYGMPFADTKDINYECLLMQGLQHLLYSFRNFLWQSVS